MSYVSEADRARGLFARPMRLGLLPSAPQPADDGSPPRDIKKLVLVTGLGILSWVATYVGMLELIEANMGDLPLVHKLIIGFSVAMLMTMIIWLLDQIFSPVGSVTRLFYVAGYLFLSVISVGFGFGFYWKVLESRAEIHALRRGRRHIRPDLAERRFDPARAAQRHAAAARDHLAREGRDRARQGHVLPQQQAGRRAPPQDARRRRGALFVRLRFRRRARRRREDRHVRPRRRPGQDRHRRRFDHRSQVRHPQRVHEGALPQARHDGVGLQRAAHRSPIEAAPRRPHRAGRKNHLRRSQERRLRLPRHAVEPGAARRRPRHRRASRFWRSRSSPPSKAPKPPSRPSAA